MSPVALQQGHPGVGPQQEVHPHGQHDEHHGGAPDAAVLPGQQIGQRVAHQDTDEGGHHRQEKGVAEDAQVLAHIGEVGQGEAAVLGGEGVHHHQHQGGHHKNGHPDHIGDGERSIPHLRPPPRPGPR